MIEALEIENKHTSTQLEEEKLKGKCEQEKSSNLEKDIKDMKVEHNNEKNHHKFDTTMLNQKLEALKMANVDKSTQLQKETLKRKREEENYSNLDKDAKKMKQQHDQEQHHHRSEITRLNQKYNALKEQQEQDQNYHNRQTTMLNQRLDNHKSETTSLNQKLNALQEQQEQEQNCHNSKTTMLNQKLEALKMADVEKSTQLQEETLNRKRDEENYSNRMKDANKMKDQYKETQHHHLSLLINEMKKNNREGNKSTKLEKKVKEMRNQHKHKQNCHKKEINMFTQKLKEQQKNHRKNVKETKKNCNATLKLSKRSARKHYESSLAAAMLSSQTKLKAEKEIKLQLERDLEVARSNRGIFLSQQGSGTHNDAPSNPAPPAEEFLSGINPLNSFGNNHREYPPWHHTSFINNILQAPTHLRVFKKWPRSNLSKIDVPFLFNLDAKYLELQDEMLRGDESNRLLFVEITYQWRFVTLVTYSPELLLTEQNLEEMNARSWYCSKTRMLFKGKQGSHLIRNDIEKDDDCK